MSTISWTNAAGGSWNVGGNWSGGVVPTAADDVVIAQPGTYTITVGNFSSNPAHSVTLNDAGANLSVGFSTTLALGGVLEVDAGTVSSSGTIAGGTIFVQGGTFAPSSGATLSGVTVEGYLPLNGSVSLSVTGGLTLEGVGGAGAGTIDVLAGSLYFTTSQTVSGGTILLDGTSFSVPVISIGSGSTLTVAANAALTAKAGASVQGQINFGSVINQGLISGPIWLSSNLLNQGTVAVGANQAFSVQSTGTLANAGLLSIASGGVLSLGGAFSNTGSISAAGGTILAGGAVTQPELLSLNATGGTVVVTGTLTNTGGTLQVGPGTALGTVTFGTGGTILNGVVQDSGGGLIEAGGTLNGVTYQGPLNLTQTNARALVQNGITLTGPGGVGPGTINLTGNNAGLSFLGTTTLSNTTINIGSSSGASLDAGQAFSQAGSLTIGTSSTITQVGQNATINAGGSFYNPVSNAGTIQAGVAGGTFQLGSFGNGAFVNTGTIAVSNGDAMTVTSLTNSGQVSVASGGVLNLQSYTPLAGGQVTETGATLNLGGALSLPALATISRSGGIVALTYTGTLDLGGGTLNLGGGSALGQLRDNGVIRNGTIHDTGGGMVFYGGAGALYGGGGTTFTSIAGQLQNVTYQGLVNLTPATSSLTVQGLTATGANGAGPGMVNLLGAASSLIFQGTQTFNNATINLGSDNATTTLTVYDPTGTGAVLTLGAGASLQQRGAMAEIDMSRGLGDGLVNQGLIAANDAGGRMIVTGGTFTNAGRIVVANGDTLALEADQVGNLPGNILTGGYWEADANSTLSLGFNNPIVTLSGAVVALNGAGSQIAYYDTTRFQTTSLEQTLQYINAGAALVIGGGRVFNDPGLLRDNGNIVLSGGTVAGSPVVVGTNALLSGFGAVTAANVYDSGHLLAQGGQLTVNGALLAGAPAGDALINSASILRLTSVSNVGIRFLANTGTLALDQPTQTHGAISGFTGADAIDLVNVNPAGLTLSYAGGAGGGVLTVKSGAATQASLRFNGNYVVGNFNLASDGHGGTLILDPPVGPGGADWKMTLADLSPPPGAPPPAGITNAGSVTTGFGAIPPETPPPTLLVHG